jgi:hypothetical protein
LVGRAVQVVRRAGPGEVEALVRLHVEFLLLPVPVGEFVRERWETVQTFL